MSTEKVTKDVAIIGAGPVGLFAVFQCGMLGFSTAVIDSLPEIGGQCTALYPEKPIYDIAGLPNVLAKDLIHNLEQQAAPFAPKYILGESVTALTQEGDKFILTSDKGRMIEAGAVIIAAGAGAFGPNRPPLDGIEDYEGQSIFYAVRDKEKFRGKKVVIAGGGDSAVDWALSLREVAEKISVVHRRDKFRAAPEMVKQLHSLGESGALTLETPYQLKGLEGKNDQLSGVRLADLDGNEKLIEADYLLPFYGLASDLGPLKNWGIEIEHNHIAVNPASAMTNLDGIYAVGDIATYPDKLKLILTGFAEVAQAAHAIYKRLKPDVPLHFEYSTSKGLPPTDSKSAA